MPKIPNWARKDDLSPDSSNGDMAWENEQNGEAIYISTKPDGGYQIVAVPPTANPPTHHNGDVIDSAETKEKAVNQARLIMRVSPHGVVDETPEKHPPN